MISTKDRLERIKLIEEHVALGGKRERACSILGIDPSTYFRWKEQIKKTGETKDLRPTAEHPEPANKLSEAERELVLKTLCSSEFVDSTPHQMVAILADRGEYIASPSTCYRVLKESGKLQHRGRTSPPRKLDPPTHVATAPNKLWSWDITYLDGPVKGIYYYLYLIIDVYSRYIVGWEVWPDQLGEYSSLLISKACLSQKIPMNSALVLHSDNGSPMKCCTMLAKLEELGIEPSFSRPRVSNDNPYSESLFKTLKYRPDFSFNGFESILAARIWTNSFVHWYNEIHHHSGIGYLTPHQRHYEDWRAILKKREETYEAAKAARPERWNGRDVRNWNISDVVYLNRVNI